MVWVKICGMTDIREALSISSLGIDALGFILSSASPRKIGINEAGKIIKALRKYNRGAPQAVGVFVNEDLDFIREAVTKLDLDIVQLSGCETPDYIKEVKKLKNFKIIKAVHCKNDTDIVSNIQQFEKIPDYYLLDTYHCNSYGGTGRTFDWNIAKGLSLSKRIILAGGLGPDNVSLALSAARPFGVDASSRLEDGTGKKNLQKVRAFIKVIRGRGNEEKK